MSIPSVPPILPMPIADSGDVRSIPEQTPTGSNQLSFQSGFPPITSNPLTAGGIPPQREDFNAAYKLLSQHIFFQQSGGVYPWVGANDDFPGLNYRAGWHVFGSDGNEYAALKASGPDVTNGGVVVGPKDPVTDTEGYWKKQSASPYELCEFYFFRHPTLRVGFQPAQGGLLENAATLYPEAWAYLQTVEGRKLCTTEGAWQAMTTATWATLADGTKVGWDGIGGAPFYAPNLDTGALRLPDLRGMYAEAAGFDSLDVGGVHGDAVRDSKGGILLVYNSNTWAGGVQLLDNNGVFELFGGPSRPGLTPTGSNMSAGSGFNMVLSRVMPTGNKNGPRAFGVLPCVYLGVPR